MVFLLQYLQGIAQQLSDVAVGPKPVSKLLRISLFTLFKKMNFIILLALL